MKKREIEQNLAEITKELEYIKNLLERVSYMVSDEVNFKEYLTAYMTELFRLNTNYVP